MNKIIVLGGGVVVAFGVETDTVAIIVIMAFLGGALTKVLGSDTVE